MQIELKPDASDVVEAAVAAGEYESPSALISELIRRFETERWVRENEHKVRAFVDAGRNSPIVDMTPAEICAALKASARTAAGV